MSTPDPTPTTAAPDWRALCQELIQAINEDVIDANDWQRFEAVVNRVRADIALATPPAVDGDERLRLVTAGICSGYIAGHDATVEGHYGDPDEVTAEMAPMVLAEVNATPPAPSPEPRGCQAPGACSCPAGAIVPPELIRALELAEAALSDIGDADREPGDDIAWAERRAAQDLPRIRHALRTWRDHATPPAATREAEHDDGDDAIDRWVDSKSDWISNWGAPRSDIAALIGEALEHWGHSTTHEAGPLPQAPTDEDLDDLCAEFSFLTDDDESHDLLIEMFRAVLARWGGAAVPVPVSERLPGPEDCDAEDRCWLCGKVEGDWRLMSVVNPGVPRLKYCFSHWLPHWALPVPAAAAGEVQP